MADQHLKHAPECTGKYGGCVSYCPVYAAPESSFDRMSRDVAEHKRDEDPIWPTPEQYTDEDGATDWRSYAEAMELSAEAARRRMSHLRHQRDQLRITLQHSIDSRRRTEGVAESLANLVATRLRETLEFVRDTEGVASERAQRMREIYNAVCVAYHQADEDIAEIRDESAGEEDTVVMQSIIKRIEGRRQIAIDGLVEALDTGSEGAELIWRTHKDTYELLLSDIKDLQYA